VESLSLPGSLALSSLLLARLTAGSSSYSMVSETAIEGLWAHCRIQSTIALT
jgi:hypothetical protein